jgi:hypothetical protein
MIWAFRQLLVPLNYLRIKHGGGLFHSKKTHDFVLPIIFAALTVAVFWLLDAPLKIFGNPDTTRRITDLLQLMMVFYLAALAAVATFERKGIDHPLKGGNATLLTTHQGVKILTHRQFISYLFGYLSFLSFILFMFMTVGDLAQDKIVELLKHNLAVYNFTIKWVSPVLFFSFLAVLWQLILTSLFGIYFLTDRLQVLSDPDA